MIAMLEEPLFWVAVSFVIFVAGVWKPMSKAILGALDKRTLHIEAELKRAAELRAEAEQLLAAYKKKYDSAVQEAEAMVQKTHADAEAYAVRAEEELKNALEKRLKMANEKIAQAEANAVKDIQNHVVDIAISAARELIQQQMQSGKGEDLAKLAAADIVRKIH